MSTIPTQAHRASTFDDGRYGWARGRRTRRRAVAGELVVLTVLVAATVGAAATADGWPTWFFITWLAGMWALVPLHSVLNLGIRGLFVRSNRSLDEHQRHLRMQSLDATHWPSAALTFAAVTGSLTIVARSGHVMPALCLGFLLWMASWVLPFWHLAWTAPDEPADD
ncbi:hypothetical protein [Blastococcus sp. SYSU DS0617]